MTAIDALCGRLSVGEHFASVGAAEDVGKRAASTKKFPDSVVPSTMMRQSNVRRSNRRRPASKTIMSRDFFALPKLRLISSERTSFENPFVEPYNAAPSS